MAIHAVLHVVEHGDTTFGTRIFQKLPNGVKSNDFKNWFEDHAGCEWDKASFKLVKGKAQTSNYHQVGRFSCGTSTKGIRFCQGI